MKDFSMIEKDPQGCRYCTACVDAKGRYQRVCEHILSLRWIEAGGVLPSVFDDTEYPTNGKIYDPIGNTTPFGAVDYTE